MPSPSSSGRVNTRRDATAWRSLGSASRSKRATSATTSRPNAPGGIRVALGSASRPISASTSSSVTNRVRCTSTSQCAIDTVPAASASAKPGNTLANARAVVIARSAA